jgi:small-conductance mechanosensitive channel/CRP-like cAMP-binding protein
VPHYPYQFLLGVILLVATLAVRALTVNHLIRSKLRLTLLSLGTYTVLNLAAAWPATATGFIAQLGSAELLLLVLGVINLLVALAINPWRVDRVPERFPNIVQDSIIIGTFLLVATLVMQEKLWTASAVSAVVVGFALQDTLGNLFAGLAIQIEKPFRVGHWIVVGGFEGRVAEITWRATKLHTKAGTVVVVPNNIVSKEAISNLSEPAAPTRIHVEVGVSYDAAPSAVKSAIAEALADAPLVLKTPEPDVILTEFGSSAIGYRVRFWIDDYAADDRARDQVRVALYYTFRRRGIQIPYPIQVQYEAEAPTAERSPARERELTRILQAVDLFRSLSDEERSAILTASVERIYGAGQGIVKQDEPGESMFIICGGELRVTIEPSGREVARLGAGSYLGEMSLLTGDPRTATVTAVKDSVLLEITAATFRTIVADHPTVVEQVSNAVAARRADLEKTRKEAAAQVFPEETPRTLLARIQRFLHLTG